MKKKIIVLFSLCCIFLISCQNNNDNDLDKKENTSSIESINSGIDNDKKGIESETQLDNAFEVNNVDKIDVNEDYDSIINMVIYATDNYISMIADKETDDTFLDCVKYEDERVYLKIRAEYQSGILSLEESPYKCICNVNEIKQIDEENVYVDMDATYDGQGIGNYKFILGVDNSRVIIKDWYYDAMDSLDVYYREHYKIEDALVFWEDIKNYENMINN